MKLSHLVACLSLITAACGDSAPDEDIRVDAIGPDTTEPDTTEPDTTEPEVDPSFDLIGTISATLYGGQGDDGSVQLEAFLQDAPPLRFEVAQLTMGDCTRYNSLVPECDPECSDGLLCQAGNHCVASPSTTFAGDITWTRADGETVVVAEQDPDGEYPYYETQFITGLWFTSGEALHVSAAGGALPAFSADVSGIAPLEAPKDSPTFAYRTDYPDDVDFVWTPATPGSTVELALRTGHHTAPPVSMILCHAPDAQGHILVHKELLVAMGFQTGIGLFQHVSEIDRVSRAIVTTPKGPLGVLTRTRGIMALSAPLPSLPEE